MRFHSSAQTGPYVIKVHLLKMQIYANFTYISYQNFYLGLSGPKMHSAERCCLCVSGTVVLNISAAEIETLKISASGTDFQRVYFPQCDQLLGPQLQ